MTTILMPEDKPYPPVLHPPHIAAEALIWAASGPKEDSTARLLSTINVAGVQMHLEAFAVDVESDEQAFVKLPADAEFDFSDEEHALYTLNETAMQTVTLNGRDYLLVAYPYGV